MNLRDIFTVTAFSLAITGCSSIPSANLDENSYGFENQKMSESWVASPAVTSIDQEYGFSIYEPDQLPGFILNKKIHIHSSEFVSTHDLVFMLQELGIQAAVSSEEIENSKVYIPRFHGSLKSFLEMLSGVADLDFRWSGNTLIIDDSKQYIVKISQQKKLAESISETVSKMGATDVSVSTEAGTISYMASSKKQVVIANYLDRVAKNASVVQMQVAVISVRLTDEEKTGFDWSQFKAEFGESGLLGIEDKGILGSATSSALGINFANNSLSIAGALNMLSSYGESKTTQNLTIQTLSGVPVTLKSGDKIPYISDIPTTVNKNTTTSGLKTDTVETGFEISLDALYDHEEQIVTVSMDLSLKSLIGFIELSAGNVLGTITQPQQQEQSLNNIVKLKAGQTALVGGLIIDSVSDNRKNLSFLGDLPTGSKSLDTQRTAVFVMMRPTVTVYTGGDEK